MSNYPPVKVTLIVEVDGHELKFTEETHLSPIGYLASAGRVVERAVIRAQHRAVEFLTKAYGEA